MISRIKFHPHALREWKKLDPQIRRKFVAKLNERMLTPEVPKDRLGDKLSNCFKIRLLSEGYRLVYEPIYQEGVLFIRSVGRRDGSVYQDALGSLTG